MESIPDYLQHTKATTTPGRATTFVSSINIRRKSIMPDNSTKQKKKKKRQLHIYIHKQIYTSRTYHMRHYYSGCFDAASIKTILRPVRPDDSCRASIMHAYTGACVLHHSREMGHRKTMQWARFSRLFPGGNNFV